jgi:diguanylate cyclase (GGDEF)-like protein/excisionase family DNA binding protein
MRVGKADGDAWLRLSEAAAVLGVSLNTLRRWSDSGRLPCYRSPGGHRRYRRTDIEALLRRQSAARPPGGDAPAGEGASIADADERAAAALPALDTLAQAAAEGIGVTACVIAAADTDGGLRVAASYTSGAGRHAAAPGDLLTRESAPVADEVLHTSRRVVIADVAASNILTPVEVDACRARGEKAVLALPLAITGQLFGVLQLVEHRSPRAFTGANVAFAEFVSRQAAGIVASAVAGDDAPARDQAPLPVADHDVRPSGDAAPPRPKDDRADAAPTLDALAEGLCRRLGAAACDVLRAGPELDVFTLAAACRPDLPSRVVPCGAYRAATVPVAVEVLHKDVVVLVDLPPGTAHDLPDWYDGPEPRHALVAPAKLGDRVRGVVRVFSASPGRVYSDHEIQYVKATASTVALALATADDGQALAERAAQLDLRVAHATQSADERDTIDCVLAFRRLVGGLAPDASVAAFELADGLFRRLDARPDDAATSSVAAPDAGLLATLGHGPAQLTTRDGETVCLLPLRAGDATTGVVELSGAPKETLLRLGETLEPAARLLAATLTARRASRQLKRRVDDLEVVVQAGIEDTASLSTDEVLLSIIKRLSELTRSPVADVYAVEGGTLRALISLDAGRVDPEWEGVVIPISRYPCSRIAVETGEIAIARSLDDRILGESGRFSLERWGYQSQLSMPLVAGGRVIGLVELSDYVPRDFSEDLELIHGLGRVAAQALENAGLFEQVERRSRILNELVEIGTFASTCRESDTVLRHVAERLLRTLDAANCDIYQSTEEGLRCVASFDRSGFDDEAVGRLLDVTTYPTIARTVSTGQVLVVSGPDDPQLSERERDVYREFGFNSEVCVPLIVNESLFGLIDIYDTRPRHYTEYLTFLRSLGMSLAGAFASTLLFEQLEHRTTVLREIVELGALAAQGGELPELLDTIAGRLRQTVGVADCDVYALDGDTLHCVASVDERGPDAEAMGRSLAMSRFPVLELAVRTREPMVVASLDDPRVTDEERSDYAEWGYQSLASIPLCSGDEVLGVLDVFDTRRRDYGDYLDFLRTVGQIVAGAMRNARLVSALTARNRELAELVDLGRLQAGPEGVMPLLRSLTQRVTEIVGSAGCQVFGEAEGGYRCLFSWEDGRPDTSGEGHLLDLERFPTTRRALDEQQILVVAGPDDEGLTEAERRHYRETEWRSDVLVPLVEEDRVVGLLETWDRSARDYQEHLDFLRRSGQIVAAALANSRLVERLERANAQLAHLVEAGLEFGSTLDTDVVLRSVARRLCLAAGATTCDIWAIEGDTMRCLTSIEGAEEDLSFKGTVYDLDLFDGVRDVVTEGRAFVVQDLTADERISEYERAENLRYGHRAKIELPLVAGGGTVGLASILDDKPREFGDLELLQSLAQVAANAIANTRLYDALERSADRVGIVGDVSFELSSSLDLGEVLHSTAQRLCALADVPGCDIYTLDGDHLVCVVSLADGETDGSWQGRTFSLEKWSALAAAIDRRMPLVIASPDDPLLSDEERALMAHYGETTEIVFPLISKGEVIGALELLETRGPRVFRPDEIDTIGAVCRVAALAIDNAGLVKDLQLRSRENEILNAIAQATTALDLPAVAAGAIEELRGLMPVKSAALLLLHDGDVETAFAVGVACDEALAEAARGLLERVRDEHVVIETPGNGSAGGVASAPRSLAVIGVPSGDGLSGLLALASPEPDAFEAVDRHLLERIGAQLAPAISNARLYADIKRMHLGNLKALSSALSAKDYYTLGHAARVAAYMVLLGEELGWDPQLLRSVEEAAYLHDIGKIGVSDRVLLKPSVLNTREWDLMRQHPVYSADIIRPLFGDELTNGVRHHHERYDGDGYPDGLAGERIPLIARAMCVVDSYDAMSFRRPYRHALSYSDCRDELARCAGAQFDPAMVAAFETVLERLHASKAAAVDVARAAAERIDAAAHATLTGPEDEQSEAYRHITAALRAVRDEHPPTRYLTTFARRGPSTVLIADAEEDERLRSHIGDDTFADEEIMRVFAGEPVDRTVLFVDQFGVWLSGVYPVVDETGEIVAVANADMPVATGATEIDGLRSDVTQTFSAMVAEAAARLGHLEFEAITDGLTGLYNHRYLHERLNEEIERCTLQGGSLGLLFIDLDDFRGFNDRHGHSAGDRALRAVARVIESSLRQVDLAARYGGEEFAVILIDTDEAGAAEVAERIRHGIADTEMTLGHEALSVSIGMALCPADASHKEELLDKADWALFLAKRRGRDQVVSFGAEHGTLTPEQAIAVHDDHVTTLADVVAARDALAKRRRAAVTRLALAAARELGLGAEAMHDVVTSAAEACDDDRDGAEHDDVPRQVATLAATYEALVTREPYRPQVSESEALEELRSCPAFACDARIADAFERVLGRPRS